MKKTIIYLISCLLLGVFPAFAQNARFVTEGTIEFERSANVYTIIQRAMSKENSSFESQAFEQVKKTQPQFKLSKARLSFTKDQTLYVAENTQEANIPFFSYLGALKQINVAVFTDFNTQQQTAQKNVFEDVFLVKDSLRQINWKITTETREIAGYSCRRANAIVLDSLYAVAFYAEQIPVSGGPESFTGLPGMILGIALPHENITWFARTVTEQPIEAKAVLPPVKGKQTDTKGLKEILLQVAKRWGTTSADFFKFYGI